ncbi:minor tail protein [Mycobacterium phage LastHope]|uniref:Minor tail protein n=1 Tax=Mycobacterium phage LastHope TaxID=2015886 RepID=A0A222ZR29_9CAUD|nr:minor tail protein [Mycobacterium phage LastHope]ASR87196.1 minor tail protein [Mycobacterium phage LastHope]
MAWAPTPPGRRTGQRGWTTDPAALTSPPRPGWIVSVHELAAALSVSHTEAALAIRATAAALSISRADAAVLLRMTAPATSVSTATAAAREHYFAEAAAVSTSKIAAAALVRAVAAAVNVSSTTAATLLRSTAVATSASKASASAAFPAMGTVEQAFVTVGEFAFVIPYQCRFIDVVLVGAGAGGNGGGGAFQSGHGGEGGKWAAITLERGVHIPWTTAVIVCIVRVGGTAGSGATVGGIATDGNPTTAQADGWAGLTASGGLHRERIGLLHQPGDGPGDFMFNNVPYIGGAPTNSGNGTPGNPPGGAGRGGNGGAFVGSNGGVGAPGAAYLRAYQ